MNVLAANSALLKKVKHAECYPFAGIRVIFPVLIAVSTYDGCKHGELHRCRKGSEYHAFPCLGESMIVAPRRQIAVQIRAMQALYNRRATGDIKYDVLVRSPPPLLTTGLLVAIKIKTRAGVKDE